MVEQEDHIWLNESRVLTSIGRLPDICSPAADNLRGPLSEPEPAGPAHGQGQGQGPAFEPRSEPGWRRMYSCMFGCKHDIVLLLCCFSMSACCDPLIHGNTFIPLQLCL